MSLLRQPIERKLSAFIGAEVTFEKLKLSLLGTSLEASGVTVAGDDPELPLLTVRKIRAELSVAKALSKQMVIKSVTIEAPVISFVIRADGTSNLPRRPPAEEPEPAEVQEHAGVEEQEPTNWRLETQRLSLTEGQIQFRDQTGGSTYLAAIEQITAELRQGSDSLSITADAAGAGRRDRQVNLGPIHAAAQFSDVTDLSRLLEAPLEAKVELTGGVVAEISSAALRQGRITVSVQAPLDLSECAASLPPSLHLPKILLGPGFSGRANLSLKLRIEGWRTLRVEELALRISQATLETKA